MSTEQRAQLKVETLGERQIHIERIFPAPRDRVFATFMDPELIPEWWGRRGDTTTVELMEPRTGGDWRFRCESPEGTIVFRGTFREVTPPERVVQTLGPGRFRSTRRWRAASRGSRPPRCATKLRSSRRAPTSPRSRSRRRQA